MIKPLRLIASILLSAMMFATTSMAFANDIDDLENEISVRKAQIQELSDDIAAYRERLDELAGQKSTLNNDIELIQNQVALTELDIQATQIEIEAAQLNLDLLNEQIRRETAHVKTQRALLKNSLFELYRSSNVSTVELVFSSQNFHELFSSIEYLETLSTNLHDTLDETKKVRQQLEEHRTDQQDQLDALQELENDLTGRIAALEGQKRAVDILLEATQSSEAEYERLLSELRGEQEYANARVSQLQQELESKLRESGGEEYVSDTSMVSPLDSYIVTATFHDPTYPWRHIYEHSGLDMAAPTGTPVRAATSGIIAWTRTVKSYGNYIMVIHDNGLATLYAHLSGFNVTADQFVGKGDVIGYVGSTGFSTGPHLHFEVRSNGIPVNPQNYIP